MVCNELLSFLYYGYFDEVMDWFDKWECNVCIADVKFDEVGEVGCIYFDWVCTHIMNGCNEDVLVEYLLVVELVINLIY